MKSLNPSTTVWASSLATRAHPIALRWFVTTTLSASMAEATPEQSFLSLLDAVVKSYVRRKSPGLSSLHSVSASLEWTSHAMFQPGRLQQIFSVRALIRPSDQCLSCEVIRGKHAMLVLPSQIDFAASIATVNRTHVVTCCVLNLSIGENWQRLLPPALSNRTVLQKLSLNSATLGAGVIKTGNRE